MPKAQQSDTSDHTSVVFFHGMGSQRRYESAAQLVDALDAYARSEDLGTLEQQEMKVVTETNRYSSERITYIESDLKPDCKRMPPSHSKVRFYEVYWAPLAADTPSFYNVVIWLFKQALVPFWVVTTPWRERERLRLSVLFRLAEASKGKVADSDVAALYGMYRDFGRDPKNGAGHFGKFAGFVEKDVQGDPKKEHLPGVCQVWHRAFIWAQVCNFLAVFTTLLYIALALLLISLSLPLLSLWIPALAGILSTFGMEAPLSEFVQDLGLPLGFFEEEADTLWFKLLSLALVGFPIVATNFFRNFLGDVLQWVTYEETNAKHQKRQAILKLGFNALAHVLKDTNCKRLIVVGHSLGSAVAMDSLLELRRYNLAAPPAKKLPLECFQGLITLGSPVDRIHYFFESYRVGKGRRYGLVVEEVRGDLGTEPFVQPNNSETYWLNVHDGGDFISSALHTPNAVQGGVGTVLSVTNIKTLNYLFPFLPQTHASYFRSRTFLRLLYEAVFEGRNNNWEAERRVPGWQTWFSRIGFFSMAAWLWLVAISLLLSASAKVSHLLLWISLGWLIVMVLCLVSHFVVRHQDDVYK